MEQGKSIRTAENLATDAERPVGYTSIEEFQTALASLLSSELMALYEVELAYGRNWAALNVDANNTSQDCFLAIHGAIKKASLALQEEGFQTEEAYDEFEGRSYHQLRISRPGIKDIYENYFQLPNRVDPEQIDEIEVEGDETELNNEQPFVPRIIP